MKVVTVFLLFIFSLNVEALNLNQCSNFSTANQPVSHMYENCINYNNRKIENALANRVYFRNCMNFGEKVEIRFTNCINDNFRELQRILKSYLSNCTNFSRDQLEYSFQFCVNRNYREIQRVINQN